MSNEKKAEKCLSPDPSDFMSKSASIKNKIKKLPPIFRIFFCIIATGLIGFGTYCLIEGFRIKDHIKTNLPKSAMDIEVDFSKPGEYESEFIQHLSVSHSQTIDLFIPELDSKLLSRETLLEELEYSWQILKPDGEIYISGDSSADYTLHNESSGSYIMLIRFFPIAEGQYQFKINVTKGCEKLTATPQKLTTRYQACGMEQLYSLLPKAIGVICFIVAGIIILSVTLITKHKKKKLQQLNTVAE
ncbi:MAG: hypothetical protein ACIAQZ_05195 [Sedimentisphaeraceae bacterium JB056]